MFGNNKKGSAPRPLNDTGRSLISETFSLEGTLRTSGAIDIAGLVKGASRGEGLGNKFLSHIRNVDTIIHVVRGFDDDDIQISLPIIGNR